VSTWYNNTSYMLLLMLCCSHMLVRSDNMGFEYDAVTDSQRATQTGSVIAGEHLATDDLFILRASFHSKNIFLIINNSIF